MDAIFNLFKVRFNDLDRIISTNCPDIDPRTKVNVYINLEPVLRKLMSVYTNNYTKVSKIDLKEFTSNVINLAAHYRLFFSKNKLYSRIYLYIPTPQPSYINSSFNNEYRQTYYHNMTKNVRYKNMTNMVSDATEIVQLICEYIEGVYFIESGSIENSVVPMIIKKENKDNYYDFIISTDIYDFQYVNYGFDVIVPKKEKSYILNKSNLIETIKLKEHVINDITVPSEMLPFILSVLGSKRRDIQKVTRMGFITILKTIDKARKNNLINDSTFNINLLCSIVRSDLACSLLNNFYMTDINSQYSTLGQYDTYFITKQIKDKFDDESLKKINDKFFGENPIMLVEVTSGTNLKQSIKKVNLFSV